jgi:hypothetical protein
MSVRDDDENNSDNTTGVHLLVAAARYLAAHSPTMHSQGHTYQTANQLYPKGTNIRHVLIIVLRL